MFGTRSRQVSSKDFRPGGSADQALAELFDDSESLVSESLPLTVSDATIAALVANASSDTNDAVQAIVATDAVLVALALTKIKRGSASLNFAEIATTASETLTIAVTGAATGDDVVVTTNAAPVAGLVYQAWVSAADVVSVRAINITADPINAAAQTIRVLVLKA
jgi:hypothetical protein